MRVTTIRHAAILPTLLAILLTPFFTYYNASAQQPDGTWNKVSTIDTAEFNLTRPAGITYLPNSNLFLIWDTNGSITGITIRKEHVKMSWLDIPVADAQNLFFDQQTNSLLAYHATTSTLARINIVETGLSVPTTGALTQFNLDALGLRDPKGMTFDPNGPLFILDSNGTQIVTVTPGPASTFDGDLAVREGRIKRIDLMKLGLGEFQGIAFNPNNKYLYSFNPNDQRLYAFSENAQIVSAYDLSSLHLENPRTLLFAPSGDVTDEPAKMNLFILDPPVQTTTAGGKLVEISLDTPILDSPSNLLPTTHIRTIDTSNASWNPSSPDPAGIAYWPLRGTLLVSDSEVDEMPPYFTGDNVFESSLTGTLLDTCSTTDINRNGWSNEPTGVAINPNNNHIFFSDDSRGGKLHEVNLGPDGTYCTSDDTVRTVDAPGGGDAEGIAYGANKLFIAGGTDREVYIFDLGPNGVLGGNDDGVVTSFDTEDLGFQDLEGIEYNPDQGTLFIVSTSNNDSYLGEVSLSGMLVNAYTLDYLGTEARSGLAYGPSSQNPAINSIYLASRGLDNDSHPDENDGKIWEIYLGDKTPAVLSITRSDSSPTNAISVDFTVTFSEAVTGVDIAAPFDDFTLTTSGSITGAAITGVVGIGDGTGYNVTVATGKYNGTLRLDVVDDDSIRDSDNNPLGGTGSGNGNFNTGQAYTVTKKYKSNLKSIAAQDGWLLETGETTNRGGTLNKAATTFYVGDNTQKNQYLTILSFSTKGLPNNAVITKVTLNVRKQGIVGGGNPVNIFQGFMVDVRKGFFGSSPGLQASDFQANANKSYGAFKPAMKNGWYAINLTLAKAYINKLNTGGGVTQLRLRFKLDDNNNAVANYLSLYSGNAPVASRPQLIVEYYVP